MENIHPDITKLIDDRSAQIWEQVNSHFCPVLKFHNQPHYMCVLNETPIGIYISKNNYNLNYFAHEILHLQIRINGPDIMTSMINHFRRVPSLSKILSEESIYSITNSLEHKKIFPIFVDGQFDQDEFTVNYNLPKVNTVDLLTMFLDFNNASAASQQDAEKYINLYFALKANQNPNLNYREQLQYLKSIDEALYKILDNFWNGWVEIDITVKTDLTSLVSTFYLELDKWIRRKYPTHFS